MAKKSKRRNRMPGLVIMMVLLIIALEFIALLAVTQLVPTYLIFVGAVGLVTFILLIFMLTRNYKKKVPFSLGCILAVMLVAVLIVGNLYVFSTYNTLTKISQVTVQTADIGVYVRADDPAESIQDTEGYTFGILSTLDRDNTAEAVAQINSILGYEVTIREETGITELADALLNGDCDAIILNYAYIVVLEDLDDYEDIQDEIKELDILSVETVVEVTSDDSDDEGSSDPDNIIRLYISGIDTRGTKIINTRSDVNIIATINTETKQILLVSTPRDYYVPLSISNGVCDKLTHAGIYGVDVSMDTLGMLYDIDLKYYFKVNFTGFVDIIDALGGIDVESDYSFTATYNKNYSFVAGTNHLDGTAALIFARERKAFSAGDRQRGKNQMAVIKAVINKAMSTELLTNYTTILSAVEGSFETNMSYDIIAELVRQQLSDGGSWNVVSYSVDGTGDSRIPYSMSAYAYVMIPDESTVEKAKELMQQVVDGEIISLDDDE